MSKRTCGKAEDRIAELEIEITRLTEEVERLKESNAHWHKRIMQFHEQEEK